MSPISRLSGRSSPSRPAQRFCPEPMHDASPATPIPEIAGPREESLVEMAMLLVRRRGEPLRIEGVRDPDDPDSELYVTGALLPGPHATLAGPTFEQWLDSA